MRILYISNEYPPDTGFGGIGTYTKHAAEGMAARGHCVYVLSRSLHIGHQCTINGVTVIRIAPESFPLPEGKLWYPFRIFCYKHFPHVLVRLAWSNGVRNALERLQDSGIRFDIIEYPECGAEGLRISGQTGKLIARLHTPWHIIQKFDEIKEPAGDHIFLPIFEKRSVRKAALVTCPSEALARIVNQQWKCNDIKVVNNPIPSGKYSQTSGGGWIYTGRVERRKGVHILIQAYAALCKTHSPPVLKLIGRAYGDLRDGSSYGDWIKRLIDQLSIKNRVQWIEGLPLDDVRRHLLSSSVAFFPSLWENFPYSSLEAMACGLAVVASDCGGYPEMIKSGKNGILVKSDSVDDLLGAMHQMMENPYLVNKLGEDARKRVSVSFDSQNICRTMEEIYLQVAQGKI